MDVHIDDAVQGITSVAGLERAVAASKTHKGIDLTLLIPDSDLPSMGGHRCDNGLFVRDEYYMWGGRGYFRANEIRDLVVMPGARTTHFYSALSRGDCICGLQEPPGKAEQALLRSLFQKYDYDPHKYGFGLRDLRRLLRTNPRAGIFLQPSDRGERVPVEVAYRGEIMQGIGKGADGKKAPNILLSSMYIVLDSAMFRRIAAAYSAA